MKTIVALHGNPGAPEDWNILERRLDPKKFQLRAFSSYGNEWQDEVRKGTDKKILIAHSWGSYRVLKNLKSLAEHIEKVILVCPYVKTEKPLSGLATLLLKAPFIGDKLIKGSHQKALQHFVKDMVSPQAMNANPYYEKIQARLQDWQVWQRAAFAKIDMQANPWNSADIADVPLVLFYGGQDKSSPFEGQHPVLIQYPRQQHQIVADGGHGLLWSHPELILSALEGV